MSRPAIVTEKPTGKPKRIWCDSRFKSKPRVMQLSHGGLRFEYTPCYHVPDGRCAFSMFHEVGQPYQPFFKGFFRKHTLSDEPVITQFTPFYHDKLA